MRLGIIDLGTNSIRFDAYEMRTRQPQLLHRERLMVRLGDKVFSNGQMTNEAIARTVGAFIGFKYNAEQFGLSKIVAVATSALRHASNRQKLVDSVKTKTGIEIQVISGNAEARFIARGVLSRENKLPEKFALVDIGGGSTEVSLCKKRQICWSTSFDLGTARIQQLFRLSDDSISTVSRLKRVKELRKHIRNVFNEFSQKHQWTNVSTLIGTSGTVKALVSLQSVNSKNKILTAIFLKKLIAKMLKLSRSKLIKIPGMDITRVDMILGGAVLLDEIMAQSGASRVILSEYALREGVLDEEAALIRDYKDSSLTHHLRDLEEHLQLSLTALPYAKTITQISEKLFEVLLPVHRLGIKWKAYLSAAAMLQNTGKAISSVKHNKHSFYIVNNLDFPWLDNQDRKILAHMCLWHSTAKVTNKDLSFLDNTSTKQSFLKALAILQIANALFWHERSSVRIIKSQVKPGQVHLKISARDAYKLLKLRVEARNKLFIKVFKRTLILV